MILLSHAQEIEIEREFICAILDGALRRPGSARQIATHAHISPVHLSYVRRGTRLPRPEMARQIARALPVPVENQKEWVYHVERVWSLKRHVRKRFRPRARDAPVSELVAEIKRAYAVANNTGEPRLAKLNYRAVKILASILIDNIQPNLDPVNYLELAFLLHDVLCVLNRSDQALWYAKRAHWTADSIDDPRVYQLSLERLDFFQVNALRCEAVALHNLGLDGEAKEICERLETLVAFKRNARFWKPHVYRDLINAITGQPRFAITRVENLVDQVKQICEARGEAYDLRLPFLISTSLARAYVAHGNFKDAARILSNWLERVDSLAPTGPLPQARFFRTWALLYSTCNDFGEEWNYFARRAAIIASEAGLEHQLSKLREEAGAHAGEIMPDSNNFR